jgi:hypothetical protein
MEGGTDYGNNPIDILRNKRVLTTIMAVAFQRETEF